MIVNNELEANNRKEARRQRNNRKKRAATKVRKKAHKARRVADSEAKQRSAADEAVAAENTTSVRATAATYASGPVSAAGISAADVLSTTKFLKKEAQELQGKEKEEAELHARRIPLWFARSLLTSLQRNCMQNQRDINNMSSKDRDASADDPVEDAVTSNTSPHIPYSS